MVVNNWILAKLLLMVLLLGGVGRGGWLWLVWTTWLVVELCGVLGLVVGLVRGVGLGVVGVGVIIIIGMMGPAPAKDGTIAPPLAPALASIVIVIPTCHMGIHPTVVMGGVGSYIGGLMLELEGLWLELVLLLLLL